MSQLVCEFVLLPVGHRRGAYMWDGLPLSLVHPGGISSSTASVHRQQGISRGQPKTPLIN